MKILSLWEPWATLMAIGAKRIETRSWRTEYRGWLAIHAAKAGMPDAEAIRTNDKAFRLALAGESFAPGCIVALVWLERCYPTKHCAPPRQEEAFGNFGPNRYAWVTSSLHRLQRPLPFRGAQGLRTLPIAIERRVWNLCGVEWPA